MMKLKQNRSQPRSFHIHQLPTLTYKQPFKQSRQVKSYVSFKEITQAGTQRDLSEVARNLLNSRGTPDILTDRIPNFLYKRRGNKENNHQQCKGIEQHSGRRVISVKERHRSNHRRRLSENMFEQSDIMLKICRLQLHETQALPVKPKTSRTRMTLKTRQRPQPRPEGLSGWQMYNFEDDFQ